MKKGLTWAESLGEDSCPYLKRWVLNFGRLGSLRLHHWLASDDLRYKHDHPCDFLTLVLKGGYTDRSLVMPGAGAEEPTLLDPSQWVESLEYLGPGSLKFRKAEHRHSVEVDPKKSCWTLLYFFPHRRQWGFWVPRRLDGFFKFKKANKYFLEHGHHPCDE